MTDLSTSLGRLVLKNPVVAASCEFTMSEAGIVACLDAGAGAVVAKSVNELPAAARQLDIADYAVLGDDHNVRPFDQARAGDSLLTRSGLAQTGLDEWLDILARCDRLARERDAYVIGSITVSAAEPAAEIAARMESVVRCVELNVGAPYGRDVAEHAVRLVTETQLVRHYTETVRAAVSCPLIVKLSGQATDVVALAQAAVAGGADVVAMVGRLPGFMPDLRTWEPVLGSFGAVGGGWSLPISCYWVGKTYRELPEAVPIVGTNGARSGADVLRFLLAGARAVEMATAVLLWGPRALTEALEEITSYAETSGLERLDEMIGAAARRARTFAEIPPAEHYPQPWSRFLPS